MCSRLCHPGLTHLGWLVGANLCRDAQGMQDALPRDIVTWGLLDEVQHNSVTTCGSRQVVRASWEATCSRYSCPTT